MAFPYSCRRAIVATLINIPKRGFKKIDETYEVENYSNVIFPPGDRKLPVVPKMPIFAEGEIPRKTGRRDIEMRGPELIHNELIHKQYGIIAQDGGEMKWDHFEALRKNINTYIAKAGEENMFAIWRLAFPWLPRTPRSKGKKRGGGKGKIAFYVTPVRHGRVILELGGFVSETHAYRILIRAASMLPYKARAVSYREMLAERELEERTKRENLNPFSWDFMTKWNMQNVTRFLSPYDLVWGGKHR